jgi:hypothetical protein
VTAAQNAATYFPEFRYAWYWRLLDRSITGKSSSFEFKNNRYSTYDRRTHFTPLWFPDGTYTPYTWLIDCWTPAGMLSMNLTATVTIRGNLWEEWHIAGKSVKKARPRGEQALAASHFHLKKGGYYDQIQEDPVHACVTFFLSACSARRFRC